MRTLLRVLAFPVVTFVAGIAFWYALLLLGFAFGASTPECTGSDTCGAWGDFLYHPWPGLTVCFLLGAAASWLLIRPLRSRNTGYR